MNKFIQFLPGDNKNGLTIEETSGYQEWFNGDCPNGVLCWVSSLGSLNGKRYLALITSVILSDTYYPEDIPANSTPYIERNSEDFAAENIYIKYKDALPLSKNELLFYAKLAEGLSRADMSKSNIQNGKFFI